MSEPVIKDNIVEGCSHGIELVGADQTDSLKQRLFEAVVDHLVEYFSDARVTGIEIHKSEAEVIAIGILRRLEGQFLG